MWTLTAFNQGALLGQVPDPKVRQGVCAALCDLWMNLMRDPAARRPEDRMDSLRATITLAIRRQMSYRDEVRAKGREAGRKFLGRGLGLNFEELTVVERRLAGRTGMVLRMQKDLELPGARMSWSLLFHGGGAHAIAGCHSVTTLCTTVHRSAVHLFDPNIGEYVGQIQDIPPIVDDMFRRIPGYQRLETMERRTVSLEDGDAEDDDRTDPFALPWDKRR